jgi:hypothetical protein
MSVEGVLCGTSRESRASSRHHKSKPQHNTLNEPIAKHSHMAANT